MPSKNEPTTSSPTLNHIRNPSLTPRKIVTGDGTSKITDLRPHIGSEMNGEFVICDIDKFMEHYLPFVPTDNHVKLCVETKLKPDKQMDESETYIFTAFRDTPVIKKEVVGKRTEMELYAPLESIAKSIAGFDLDDLGRKHNKFNYRNVLHDTIKSNINGSNHKVDACFTTDEKAELGDHRVITWGMAVPVEQKVSTSKTDWLDNNEKILSANVQIMNDDNRRMFTFGITIEADQMTLWYHSRSHSAVSKSFNFVKDPNRLIKVFMSFLFATEVELGYDPMVERQDDGEYVFKIPQTDETFRFYRTVKLISGYRSNNITGRMPRVWLVESYDPATHKTGEQFVLKDVWLDSNAATEREIQTAIFKGINEFGDGDAPSDSPGLSTIWEDRKDLIRSRDYEQFFLKIEDDYPNGCVSKEIASGAQRIWGLFKSTQEAYTSKRTATRPEAGQSRPIASALPKDLIRVFAPKKQYRVLFKEVCRSVGELEMLGEAIDVIQQAHIALQLLYCAGWVHRDISEGNILAHRKNPQDGSTPWKAKLMDLEYAKKFPPPDNHEAAVDPKTGTPYFMPTEILANLYLFVPRPKRRNYDQYEGRASETTPDAPVVMHNFQHDLESLWWLIIWLITSHVADQPVESWPSPIIRVNAVQNSRTWAAPIFQNIVELPRDRRKFFLTSIENKLSEFLPKNVADHVWRLEHIRGDMYNDFLDRVEFGNLHDQESYADIHIRFGRFFTGLQAGVPSKDWRGYFLKKQETSKAEGTSRANETLKAEGTSNAKGDSNPLESAPAGEASLPAPSKVKAKRGPDQNPNLEEQGRAGGSQAGGKKSRRRR